MTLQMYDCLKKPNATLGPISAVDMNVSVLCRMLNRFLVSVFVVFLITGCGKIPSDIRQSLVTVIPHKVDFAELLYYAERSQAAYNSPDEIRQKFPNAKRVTTVHPIEV